MAVPVCNFIFTLENGTVITHTVLPPDWGNRLVDTHGFTKRRTIGGAPKSSRRGGRYRQAQFDFVDLSNDDRIALSNLFGPGHANGSQRWFYFEWPIANGLKWVEPIFPGAHDGTDYYNPGHNTYPGQNVETVYIKWRCNLTDGDLIWSEGSDEFHNLSFTLDILDDQPLGANW